MFTVLILVLQTQAQIGGHGVWRRKAKATSGVGSPRRNAPAAGQGGALGARSPVLREGNLRLGLETCSPVPSPPAAAPALLLLSLRGAPPRSHRPFGCHRRIAAPPEAALPRVFSPICMLQPVPLAPKRRSLFPRSPMALLLWVQSWAGGGTPLLPPPRVSRPLAASSPLYLQGGLRFACGLHLDFGLHLVFGLHLLLPPPWAAGARSSAPALHRPPPLWCMQMCQMFFPSVRTWGL